MLTVPVAEVGNKVLTVVCAGSGTIDVSEVRGALKTYGRPSDRTTVVKIIMDGDDAGDGTVTYQAFKRCVNEHAGNPDEPLTALYQVLSSPCAACGTGEHIDRVVRHLWQAMKDKLCSPIMQDLGRVKVSSFVSLYSAHPTEVNPHTSPSSQTFNDRSIHCSATLRTRHGKPPHPSLGETPHWHTHQKCGSSAQL